MIIALDVDDVVLDMIGHYTNVLKRMGYWRGVDNKAWCLKQRYELTDEEFKQTWQEALLGFSTLELVQGAKEYLQYIDTLQPKYQVVFVTAVDKSRYQDRIDNLQMRLADDVNFIKERKFDLICTGEYSSKKEALKLLRPVLFVDDRLQNHYDVKDAAFDKIYVDHDNYHEPHLQEMKQSKNFHIATNMSEVMDKTIEILE